MTESMFLWIWAIAGTVIILASAVWQGFKNGEDVDAVGMPPLMIGLGIGLFWPLAIVAGVVATMLIGLLRLGKALRAYSERRAIPSPPPVELIGEGPHRSAAVCPSCRRALDTDDAIERAEPHRRLAGIDVR